MTALNIIIFEKDNIIYVTLVNVDMYFNLIVTKFCSFINMADYMNVFFLIPFISLK